MIRRRYRILGRVQGVGFRWFVSARARELRLGGWVRNRIDGTVECAAEGEESVLAAFEEALAEGPPGARVERVETAEEAAEGAESFAIEG